MRYTKEQLEKIVPESRSFAEVLRKLDLKVSGGAQTTLINRCKIFNISTDHFTGSLWNKGLKTGYKRNLEEYLVLNGLKLGSWKLKKRLVESTVLEDVCVACGLGNEWNGKSISLHLDHINGNNKDNRLENLRILCPNCHSQTDTYCGKSKGKKL